MAALSKTTTTGLSNGTLCAKSSIAETMKSALMFRSENLVKLKLAELNMPKTLIFRIPEERFREFHLLPASRKASTGSSKTRIHRHSTDQDVRQHKVAVSAADSFFLHCRDSRPDMS